MMNAEGEKKAFVCQSAERAGEKGFLAFGFYKESVGKAGGDKWKSLSDAEKAPFVATAEKKKQEYEKTILAYNKKLEGKNSEEDESDKSKSEVNDDEEDEVD
ncbi:HMG1/2-like protein [Glycine max]|nr:HMG1/2-like protein [Glycine max]